MRLREFTVLPATLLGLALLPDVSNAQALPDGTELGMSAKELHQAVPALERVARPTRMAGGLAGSWRGPALDVGGVRMVPTYFFGQAHLRRVEYAAQTGDVANAFDALLAWGRTAWGAEQATQDRDSRYASWTAGEVDAYLQQAGAQVRLVIARRVLKDASEL